MIIARIVYTVFNFFILGLGLSFLYYGTNFFLIMKEINMAIEDSADIGQVILMSLGGISVIAAVIGICCCCWRNVYVYTLHGLAMIAITCMSFAVIILIQDNAKDFNRVKNKLLKEAMPALIVPARGNQTHIRKADKKMLLLIMRDFECCGINGKADYTLPANKELNLPLFCCQESFRECSQQNSYDIGCKMVLDEEYATLHSKVIPQLAFVGCISGMTSGFSAFYSFQIRHLKYINY